MASSYSTQLRIELMASGENDSTWGTKNNTSLQLLEAAIAGRAAVTHDDTANYTLTTANGSADEARRMIIDIGGALGAARNVVVPTQTKFYVVKNSTTGGYAVTVKTSGGTGIAVPNGKTMLLFCDGTNVVEAINQVVGTLALTSPDITTSITTPSTTFSLVNATATTVNLAGAATTVSMGAGAASTLNANFTTAINLNTAAIVSNQTTVAVINTNATTVNAFGAASVALNIGHASAAAAFPGGISIPDNKAVASGATCTAFAGATTLLTIGGTGATSVVAIPGTKEATNSTTASVTLAGGLAVAKKLFVGTDLSVGADLYTTVWTDYSGTSTLVGWAATPAAIIYYKRVGKLVFVHYNIQGTSNSTTTTFTLPLAIATGVAESVGFTNANGTLSFGRVALLGSTVTLYTNVNDAFINSGTKNVLGQFQYETS